MPTKVMIMGLGPIGAAVARQLRARSNFKIVAAVDIDPAKAGKDLGELLGSGKRAGVKVVTDAAAAIRKARPQVAVLCTSSSLRKVWPQLEAVLRLKLPIVSTTEELSYPWYSNRALARKIDAAAKRARVAVVGTGVNPGFAMDALPIALTAICERVDALRVERVQDARIRRLPFQQKIGSGLTPEQFAEKVKDLSVRHVGLTESVAMIADAVGWKLDRVTDEIQPKIAQAPVESQFLKVPAGRVCGIVQDGLGYTPTPVVSHAILTYNRGRRSGLADGVVISHTTSALEVIKAGFEQYVADAARDYGLLYGLATALMALLTGWLASAVFRRD